MSTSSANTPLFGNHHYHHQQHHHANGGSSSSSSSGAQQRAFPVDVGILAMDVYFPAQYVSQEKLEVFDSVSTGKYTIGLGQSKMAFCLDNEDINSLCLTVLSNLMEKYAIGAHEIGRLEVGTETLIDKSKSVKSTLMTLFERSGNTDLEGVDSVNACFGGTAAIFNAINWIESSYWDGRYALVVTGDLALYAKGSARPTGGAGAIAFLIGPHAPLVFERGLRALHVVHSYDFYKPIMDSEYPIVDGKLSVICYLNALDKCYQLYKRKFQAVYAPHDDLNNNVSHGLSNVTANSSSNSSNSSSSVSNGSSQSNGNTAKGDDDAGRETAKRLKCESDPQEATPASSTTNGSNTTPRFNLNSASAFLFHSPYCKLVQKSFARLLWNDFLEEEEANGSGGGEKCGTLGDVLDRFKKLSNEESFIDKQLEKELIRVSEPMFKKKTLPSLFFAKEVGNMYTPSLYACLASHLLSKPIEELSSTRLVLFSYGSGSASAMFSLLVRPSGVTGQPQERFSLGRLLDVLAEQKARLVHSRIEVEPLLHDAYLREREATYKRPNRQPVVDTRTLYPGTWYLTSIDANYRRAYERTRANVATNGDATDANANDDQPFDARLAKELLDKQLAQLS